jgi:antitoxin MazE
MKTRIIRIGNSQGVRIPKLLIEESGLGDEVELEVQSNQIIIRAVGKPRSGWDAAFKAMAERGDDILLDPVARETWDEDEWEW